MPLFHSYTSHHCTVSYHHIVLNTKSPTPLFIYTRRTLIFRILHSWKTYNSCFTRRSIRQNRRASIFSFSQRWKTLFFLFRAERHLFLYFPTDDRYNLAFLHAITYVCIIIHHIFLLDNQRASPTPPRYCWCRTACCVKYVKWGGGGYQILSGLHIYGTFTVRTVCNLCHIYSAFYNVTNLCTVRRVPNLWLAKCTVRKMYLFHGRYKVSYLPDLLPIYNA